MKLITRHELDRRSGRELSALFRRASKALTSAPPGSAERCNALATLENINRVQAARLPPPDNSS